MTKDSKGENKNWFLIYISVQDKYKCSFEENKLHTNYTKQKKRRNGKGH